MLQLFKHKKNSDIDDMLIEYYKQDSKRPDFLEPLESKLLQTDIREDSQYLLSIIGIIAQIENTDEKVKFLEKITQEIVLQIVRLNK